MKASLFSLALFSLVSTSAQANEAVIPAYGMTCTAANGASVMLIPSQNASEVEITLTNAAGFEVGSNIHTAVRLDRGSRVVYEFSAWLEMDQKARLVLKDAENMSGASFQFGFDSEADLGMPRSYPECDVM